MTLGNVSHSLETGNLEIFADHLLEKAFQGLFENAIAHGNTITRIRVFYRVIPEGVIIIFEDNGSGIPLDMKERIFSREEGIHSSLRGLFFVREILDLTGITIRETGEPGKGARFEIIVPKVSYRISGTG
ncbi:MAG: sensor histidine kinase [Methanomicrobiales archaeon]